MHRIDVPSATTDNKFTDGSPTGGIPATTVPATWLNDLQENILMVGASASSPNLGAINQWHTPQ